MSDKGSEEAAARIATYRLFARLTLSEVDRALATSLLDLPVLGEALTASSGLDAVRPLRAEYTRLFLMDLQPYESVFLDDSGMLNAGRSAALLDHYREQSFDHPAMLSVGAPDHLGLELEFMAHLLDGQVSAQRHGQASRSEFLRAAQLHLLGSHLLCWGPIFGRLLVEHASSPFYRRLGESIETFLLGDFQHVAE